MSGEMEEEKEVRVKVAVGASDEKPADEKPLEEMTREEMEGVCRELQDKADQNHDLYLRSMADVENIKKRAAKEKEDWVKYANENLIRALLPVMDNLEKAIIHAREGISVHALREGVELTLKGLKESLGRSGLQEVEAQGQPFDPRYHQAVYEAADDRAPPGTVMQEFQKGYIFNGRLLRPAMVVVSSGPEKDTEKREEEIPREGSL